MRVNSCVQFVSQVGRDRLIVLTHPGALKPLSRPCLQTLGTHQTGHPLASHADALFCQVGVYSRTAIGAPAAFIAAANQNGELTVATDAIAFATTLPSVKARNRHPSQRLQPSGRRRRPLRSDQLEFHRWSLAKKAAAFFSRSRSPRRSLISLRSRHNSSRSAVVRPVRPPYPPFQKRLRKRVKPNRQHTRRSAGVH